MFLRILTDIFKSGYNRSQVPYSRMGLVRRKFKWKTRFKNKHNCELFQSNFYSIFLKYLHGKLLTNFLGKVLKYFLKFSNSNYFVDKTKLLTNLFWDKAITVPIAGEIRENLATLLSQPCLNRRTKHMSQRNIVKNFLCGESFSSLKHIWPLL